MLQIIPPEEGGLGGVGVTSDVFERAEDKDAARAKVASENPGGGEAELSFTFFKGDGTLKLRDHPFCSQRCRRRIKDPATKRLGARISRGSS